MASSASSTPASVVQPFVEALRASLALRSANDFPPGAWRATAAGASGADAFLCHLSHSITAAISSVASYAAAARSLLQSTRDILPSEHDPRCDELEVNIDSAELVKTVALERELCAVDDALGRWRAERAAVAWAASSLGADELWAQRTKLTDLLDSVEAQLLALPTIVVEPPYIGLVVVDSPGLLAGAEALGRVVAPQAVTAADLSLVAAPPRTWPGDVLQVRLALNSKLHASESSEELGVSLRAAASAVHVDAWVDTAEAAPQHLLASVSFDVPARSVVVSFSVPVVAAVGATVRLGPVTLAGQPVAGTLGALMIKVGGLRRAPGALLILLILPLPLTCVFPSCPAPPTSRLSTRPGCNPSSPPVARAAPARGMRSTVARSTASAPTTFTRAATGGRDSSC